MLTVAVPHLVVEIGLILRHQARSAEVPDGGDETREDRFRLFRDPTVGFALPCCLLPLEFGAGALGWVKQLREFRLNLWLDRRGLLETIPSSTEPPILVIQRDGEREGRQFVVFGRPCGDLLGHVVEIRSAECPIGTKNRHEPVIGHTPAAFTLPRTLLGDAVPEQRAVKLGPRLVQFRQILADFFEQAAAIVLSDWKFTRH
ncbi:hypothetical protein BRX43_07095 [Sphingomonas sp. S-NIH.Pt15_0812]|nr:hypothetical protein BRX43_07095 [Sphingomonas sp. S-NIH.Pt15_0812]